MGAGRPRAALQAIGAAETALPISEDTAFGLALRRCAAFQALGDTENEIAALEAARAQQPDNLHVLRHLSVALMEAGRPAEARRHMAHLNRLSVARLPLSLMEGLDRLRAEVPSEQEWTPAMQWAWSIADQQAWDRQGWWVEAERGRRIVGLMKEWWTSAPERADEIGALVEAADLSALRAAAGKGRGCLVVGGHFSAAAGAVRFLQMSGLRFRTIGFAGVDPDGDETRIPFRTNPFATIRQLIRELESGAVVGVMADSPLAGDALDFPFLSRSVRIGTLVPRLAWRSGVPSFWCHPAWRGSRIKVDLERLPVPAAGESEAEWVQRWCRAYLQKLETAMRDSPENLGLRAGIWLNAEEGPISRSARHR
jgi:hypothetical protein